MENRRTLYGNRHKIKNSREPHKPDKDEIKKRFEAQEKLGANREIITPLEPATPAEDTVVVTPKCVICAYPFEAPSVICPNCRNCQACGKLNDDPYSNSCIQCGNHIEGPRLDDSIPKVGAP